MPTHAETAPDLPIVNELDQIRQEHNVAAFGACIIREGNVLWSGARGIADRATKRMVSADSQFRIGSITKAFTALALLNAQAEGRLELSDPLSKTVRPPLYKNAWQQHHPIRLSHLLEHTAGLFDMSGIEFRDKNPKPLSLLEGLQVRPESRVVQWAPGLHSSYSNSGAGLAALALERATGLSYEALVRRDVFRPLGMSSASVFRTPLAARNLVTGYDTDGKTVIPYWHMVFRPFGAINATPSDMCRFLTMLIDRGTLQGRPIYPPHMIERMERPETTLAARAGLTFGYGLGLYQYPHQGHMLVGHGGDADGYLAHMGYHAKSRNGFFVVINAFNHKPLRVMRRRLEDFTIAFVDQPEKPAVPELDSAALDAWTGTYETTTTRFPGSDWLSGKRSQIEVIVDGKRLQTRTNGRLRPLLPVAENLFRRPDESEATAAFIQESGKVYLQGRMGNFVRIETRQSGSEL